MAPVRVLFLSPVNYEQSAKEKELEDSEKRAHAARVSHNTNRQGGFNFPRNKLPLHKHRKPPTQDGARFRAERGLVVLLRGCSDPFNAFPLQITPETNHLIGHVRDLLLPNLFVPPFMRRLTLGVAKSISYQDSTSVVGGSSFVRGFEMFSKGNEGTCLAWLSSHMPAIRRITSGQPSRDSPVEELRMRAKSLLLLQQELRKRPVLSPDVLIRVRSHVRALFQGECMTHDVKAAKIHAQILLNLDDQFIDEMEHVHHALVVMWGATELACKRLERTLVPFGDYLTNALSNFWTIASAQLPQIYAGTEIVHPCVTNPLLRTAFIRLRYCLSIGEGTVPFTTPVQRLRGDMLFGWIATRTLFDMGTLMNLYVDLIEDGAPTELEGKQLVEASMILTFLHVLRKCIHEAPINGVDLRDASHVMMPRLQRDLRKAVRTLKPAERHYYNDALLWMIYVGAVYEQGLECGNQVPGHAEYTGSRTWFTQMFAKHAYKMNIWTWPDATAVLNRFIYSEHLCPQGHLWFDEVICA